MAEQYGTSVSTIQTALVSLAEEGLIECTRGRGTFVLGSVARLNSVGLYFGMDFLQGREMAAYRVLYRKLTDALTGRGVKHSLWADVRSEEEQQEPLPAFLSAVSQRQMQGVIVGNANRQEMKWLKRLGIPVAEFSSAPVTTRVEMDGPRMMQDALTELKRQGCRSAGMIFPRAVSDVFQTPISENVRDAMRAFVDSSADLGIKTKDSWVRLPEKHLMPEDYENFGYHQFGELWKQPQRPDGLVIFPDIVARGSITAILQEGVSVPGDLKLVLHRNEGIPLLCPLPVAWIESDLTAVAVALIGQIEKQLAGQPVEPVFIPHTLQTAPL
jgi:DNA-binding LacI/PurR family transcriptional regulator